MRIGLYPSARKSVFPCGATADATPASLRPGPHPDYVGQKMAKVHWRDVPLCHGRRASETAAVGPDDPRRVTLLREHRRSGHMVEGWACTPEDLWLLENHEAAVVLPGPEEIDWTGFPD